MRMLEEFFPEYAAKLDEIDELHREERFTDGDPT